MAYMHELKMNVKVDKDELLKKLQENRANHRKIVAEARKGYVDKAKKALEEKLAALREGKLVSLSFSLNPPQDHTGVYDTVIQMLELHQETTLSLTAGEVRSLVMDEWDWIRSFLIANSAYSNSAQEYAATKNIQVNADSDDDLVGINGPG